MKIVILVSYTYPFVGSGLGQVAIAQAEGLVKMGHDVVLVSANVPKTKKRFRRNGVLHIKLASLNFLNKFSIPVPLFLFNPEVINHIKSADIVHCHDMLYPYSLQGALIAKVFRKPFILTQHAGFILYSSRVINIIQIFVNRTVGKIVLRLSDKVMVVNEGVKSWLGKDGEKAVTLMNGVDNDLFYPISNSKKAQLRKKYKLPTNKTIVLYVGRLVKKKGFHRLFENRSTEYMTIICGGGNIPEEMKNEKNVVWFTGELPQEKLKEIYQLSDIFVLPSDSEGFPLSIQEAMACGLPVVTSNHPGFDKYLDRRYVKLINPANGELKRTIVQIVKNKKLRKEMSNYSVRTISKMASWQNNLSSLIEIYQGTI